MVWPFLPEITGSNSLKTQTIQFTIFPASLDAYHCMCVFQGAEQEPGSQGGGPDIPRPSCPALLEDAEKRAQPPDGRSLLGPQQHGSPVSKFTRDVH